MNRYRRIDYEKYIGCHHDDNDELVGGIAIPMVAMYDSEHMTEEEAKEHIMVDEESKYIMLIERSKYDNILRPAVDEAIAKAIEESKKPTGMFIGKILYYYDKEEGGMPEKCRVDGFTKDDKGYISEMSLTFFDEDDHEVDFDVFKEGVTEYLFETLEDVTNDKHIDT